MSKEKQKCPDCGRDSYSRGYCKKHYDKRKRAGEFGPPRPYFRTVEERFDYYTDRSGECWLWTGAKRKGYGVVSVGTEQELAHRVSYQNATGMFLRSDQVVHHTCHKPACVNPDHLIMVTQSENVSEGLLVMALKSALKEYAPNHPLLIS